MNPRLVLAIILLSLIVIFIVQNATVVTLNFLFWKLSVSRGLMIFLVFVIGIVVGWSITVWSRYHHKK